MTNAALNTLAAIAADNATARAEFAARGIRDVITVMKWKSGLHEVSGRFVSGRFGGSYAPATLAEWAKQKFGAGKLRLVDTGNIQGRETATYEII